METVLGIGGLLGHDSNAALIVDGKLVAASQEERFSRIKHDGTFPALAIADCLLQGGLAYGQVNNVVFAEKPLQSFLFARTGFAGNALTRTLGRILPEKWSGGYNKAARGLFPRAKFRYSWHHLTHVAGAFHTSNFDRAAFLCIDGKGEDYSASAGVIDHGRLELLWEQAYENGLGMFYTLVTYYLGFSSFGSEYKVMGLAPYGKPTYEAKLGRLFTTDACGGFSLRAPLRFTEDSLKGAFSEVARATGVPARGATDALTEEHLNIASSLQKIFEDEVFKMARFIRSETTENNLIFCGGCAQNCVVAGQLRTAKIFRDVFNSPVGGDMGSGLGAAALCEREIQRKRPFVLKAEGFLLGPEPGLIPADAQSWRVEFEGDLHAYVANQLAAGNVVGWVRGRMELGARALGARSIIADPRQPMMQSVLNLKVKFRESFRPFAPAILSEDCGEWFDPDYPSDFMQYTASLLPSRRRSQPAHFTSLREQLDFPRCEIPSVIHADYSARLQTVRPEIHPDFHRLISAFKAVTGVPILINTSFNVSGQPIVRSAAEAWECFLNTDIDLLVLNDRIFRNPRQKSRDEKLSWLKQFAKSA